MTMLMRMAALANEVTPVDVPFGAELSIVSGMLVGKSEFKPDDSSTTYYTFRVATIGDTVKVTVSPEMYDKVPEESAICCIGSKKIYDGQLKIVALAVKPVGKSK